MGYWAYTILGGDSPLDHLSAYGYIFDKHAKNKMSQIDSLYPLEKISASKKLCKDLRVVFEEHFDEFIEQAEAYDSDVRGGSLYGTGFRCYGNRCRLKRYCHS